MSMIKTCPVCEEEYKTKEGRQISCSNVCGNKLRSAHVPQRRTPEAPTQPFVSINDLPPVESLPADYVKRCHDYWAGLTGEQVHTRRIA